MLDEAISVPRLQGTGVGVQVFGRDWPEDEEAAAGWKRGQHGDCLRKAMAGARGSVLSSGQESDWIRRAIGLTWHLCSESL